MKKCHLIVITKTFVMAVISNFLIKNLFILLIVKQILAGQCAQKSFCSCNFENGFGYDLKPLESTNFQSNSTTIAGLEYFFRPCSDSTTLPSYNSSNGNECTGNNTKFGVCFYNANEQKFTLLGRNENVKMIDSDATVYLQYDHKNKTTKIYLVCTNIEQSYLFENKSNEPKESEYNLILFSKYACMQELFIVSTLSTGALLNITFLIIVFAYLTIGTGVDYFLMGARGIEVIPNLAFWKDFPFLVRDGVKFVQNGCKIQPSDLSENRDVYTSI